MLACATVMVFPALNTNIRTYCNSERKKDELENRFQSIGLKSDAVLKILVALIQKDTNIILYQKPT